MSSPVNNPDEKPTDAVQKFPDGEKKTASTVEQEQEALLMSRYPGLCGRGKSKLVQRSLSEKHKYFDSGDYAMELAKGNGVSSKIKPSNANAVANEKVTATCSSEKNDAPPTDNDNAITEQDLDDQIRVSTKEIMMLKKRGSLNQQLSTTGELIPTPENVPHKKAVPPLKKQLTIS